MGECPTHPQFYVTEKTRKQLELFGVIFVKCSRIPKIRDSVPVTNTATNCYIALGLLPPDFDVFEEQ